MQKVKLITFITALMLTATAQASYMFSCDLTGQIMTEPENIRAYYNNRKGQEVESSTSQFMFKASKAAPGGRADGDCKTYLNKVIEVKFEISNPVRLKKNATIRINVMVADGENTPLLTSFSLLD